MDNTPRIAARAGEKRGLVAIIFKRYKKILHVAIRAERTGNNGYIMRHAGANKEKRPPTDEVQMPVKALGPLTGARSLVFWFLYILDFINCNLAYN